MNDGNTENKTDESMSSGPKNRWWIKIAVVGTILPIVAAIAVPTFNSYEEKVSKQVAKQDCDYPQEEYLKGLSEILARDEKVQAMIPAPNLEARELSTTVINTTKQLISKIERCEDKTEVQALLKTITGMHEKLTPLL